MLRGGTWRSAAAAAAAAANGRSKFSLKREREKETKKETCALPSLALSANASGTYALLSRVCKCVLSYVVDKKTSAAPAALPGPAVY